MKSAGIAFGLALAATVGCGSGAGSADGGAGAGATTGGGGAGSGGAAACPDVFPPGASMTWRDGDGAECAKEIMATYFTKGFLEVDGTPANKPSVGFQVLAHGTTLGGSYACQTDPHAPEPYAVFFATGTIQSCTVTIENPGVLGGAHVTGTFSAMTTAPGASATITDGRFDVPLR